MVQADPAVAAATVASLPESALADVWRYLDRHVRTDVVRVAALDREVRTAGEKAGQEISDQLDLPFKVIESLLLSYFRLRNRLSDAGWDTVEAQLGNRLARDQLDSTRHQVGGDPRAAEFEVVSLGIRMGPQVLHRAVVRGLPTTDASED